MNFYDWCLEHEKEDLLKDWDYKKNLSLTPHDVSKAANRTVWWKCHICGHEWTAQVNSRYRGSGCRLCGYKRVSMSRRTPNIGESLLDKCPELSQEWHPTKNMGLQPENVPFKSSYKAWWLGACGHEWQAVVSSRATGTGCPYCSNVRVLTGYNDFETIFPEIAQEWHPTKNGDLTPKNVVAKSNKKVWWQCHVCGNEWEAAVSKRALGQGCPLCAQWIRTSFPEKAIAFYLRKAGVDVVENYCAEWLNSFEVDCYLPNMRIAVEYDGYPWHQDVEKDLRKSNLCRQNGIALIRIRDDRCPIINDGFLCRYIQGRNENSLNAAIEFVISVLQHDYQLSILSETDVNVARDRMHIYELMELREQEQSFARLRPDLIDEWNSEKNGSIRPEDVTPFSDKKVWWKCKAHGHEWEAAIKSRTKGSGCPICSGNQVLAGFNDLATIAPKLAAEWHPTRNIPLTALEVTPQSSLKIWWQCHECGYAWKAAVYSRNGAQKGCPECARKRVHAKLRMPKPGQSLLERDPSLAAQWHPEKNGELKPENVTLNTHQKVWWLGQCGHEWEAVVYSRRAGNGCPICYAESRKRK